MFEVNYDVEKWCGRVRSHDISRERVRVGDQSKGFVCSYVPVYNLQVMLVHAVAACAGRDVCLGTSTSWFCTSSREEDDHHD